MKRWICPRCQNQGDASPPGPDTCGSCGLTRPSAGWAWLLEVGEVLDRNYRVERVMAPSGTHATYLARELGPDGTPVDPTLAIKALFPARAEGPFLRQLQNEASVLQQLDHPHIVQLRGFVHRAGHAPYLVTRHESGGTLAAHVERVGPLPDPVALAIASQLASALAAVHRHRVVHLDLAPSNVVFEAEVGVDAVPHCRLTHFSLVGSVAQGFGTPEFAAPEQFEPHPVTPAADVFALGALLWWMLEGEPLVRFTDRTNPTRCLDEWVTALARRPRGRRSPEVDRWLDETLQAVPDRRPAAHALTDDGDATLARHGDDGPALTSQSLGIAMGTRLDQGRVPPPAADDDQVDEADALTEVNAPWPAVLGAGGPETPAGIGSGPRAGASSGPRASSSPGLQSAVSETTPSPLSSYSGTWQTPSGPRTLASGISAVRGRPSLTSQSQITGYRPPPSPARSVLTSAAVVVVAFLVAAAGVVAGYLAMMTWGAS